MSKYRARPPQTPATIRSERLRSRRFAAPFSSVWVCSLMAEGSRVGGSATIRNDPGTTLKRPESVGRDRDAVALVDPALHTRRVAERDHARGEVARHDRAGADDGVVADRDARAHDRAAAEPDVVPDRDRLPILPAAPSWLRV